MVGNLKFSYILIQTNLLYSKHLQFIYKTKLNTTCLAKLIKRFLHKIPVNKSYKHSKRVYNYVQYTQNISIYITSHKIYRLLLYANLGDVSRKSPTSEA